jgi:hypothetical protein
MNNSSTPASSISVSNFYEVNKHAEIVRLQIFTRFRGFGILIHVKAERQGLEDKKVQQKLKLPIEKSHYWYPSILHERFIINRFFNRISSIYPPFPLAIGKEKLH